MFLTLRTRRRTAWIAVLALLLAALAPSFAQARALGNWKASGVWAEVCGPGGGKMVRIGDAPAQPADGVLHLEHCPFCALDLPPALQPAAPPSFDAPALPAARPFLFYHASRTLQAWSQAQSRAPPSLS